jgi:hypothetical protein
MLTHFGFIVALVVGTCAIPFAAARELIVIEFNS